MAWYNSAVLPLPIRLTHQFMKQYLRMKPVKIDLIFWMNLEVFLHFYLKVVIMLIFRVVNTNSLF
ncbi:hypothetical protein AWE77_24385 [Escherichia coli]|nr:hypothetical protein AWE77_24385 [Escherichia coli]